ncbi:hypothetical protein HJC23_013146 [Cyclotella cryptica]|uniref:OTU domain-containing protein n=1 Tax=Cyclotella cryptica TaxID=29204 RepID=A0ABD3QRI3_9STRA|eukprot:CCRYP_003954-RA/>CCRYP_003954-RA protein AED:0.06 eAED:0.06 QI:0/-1/0/1/-1/1/1/0/593
MSRSSSLRQTLQLSADHTLEVLSVEPSGDCFYDCIHALLARRDATVDLTTSPMGLWSRDHDANEWSTSTIPSSQTMRDYVADQLTSEQFDLYRMYATAGVLEYSWMTSANAPGNLQELRDFAKRSGRRHGPGKCLWADEFALRTVSDGLHLTILIVDDQAQSGRGFSMKRKRGKGETNSHTDGRFVSIGNYRSAVILHRSRREHYNCLIIDSLSVFDLETSPVYSRCSSVNVDNQNCNEPNPKNSETKPVSDGRVLPTTKIDSKKEKNLTKQRIGKFYCGCAGFSNSKWVGNFYPKTIVGNNSDRQLSHYQEYFSTVEVNSTFYGVPSEATVSKWKSLCSKSFRLVLKAPKAVTHEHESLNISTLVFFLNRMQPLRDILQCVLIQCPRTLVVDVTQLEQMKKAWKEEASWYAGYFAFEFRNKTSFYDTDVRDFLTENKWPLVMHPDSLERSTIGTSVAGRGTSDIIEYEPQLLSELAQTGLVTSTSDMVYVRLHGTNDEHQGEYNARQLRNIASQIHSWRMQGLDVYCFFLNDLEPLAVACPQKYGADPWERWAAMPKNAKHLEKLVFELTGEQIPEAPRKPRSTLLNYFAKK